MTELEQYRQEIDRIDGELVQLFLERMAVTGKVGEYKQRAGIPVLDAGREKQVIAAKTALTDDPARKADVAALYEEIMAISRRQQRKLVREGAEEPGYAAYAAALAARREPVAAPRVVYQGEPVAAPRVVYQGEPGWPPPGGLREAWCYSEEAAVGFFGPEVSSRGLAWFPDVFAALERGEADYAVLPVENSSTGSIRQVYDLLAQYNYYVVGECQVKVEHCLMALPGVALEDIHTVYSHEQGLMQCERYLDAHRGWRRVPTLDTAGSAKQVAESGDRTAAAICSRRAAQIYGLHILAEGVNYNAMNHTRFVVVSPVLELRPGRNKISAVFRLPHQSGSLHEILTVFAVQGLNLLKIESRPIPGRGWEYLFFLDFTGDLAAPEMDGVLHELGQLAAEFRILGNFRGYEP
ncbi:MAG: bifunctional chorismate mutase/prephenate dehydratase [Flavonifractor plautii]